MKIEITGKGINVFNTTKAYANKKLQKFERYFNENAEVVVKLSPTQKKGDKLKVEITIKTEDFIVRAEESGINGQAAINECISDLERQIRKHKAKIEKQMRTGVDKTKMYEVKTEEEKDDGPFITKTKHFDMIPMTPEKAAEQMDMLGHTFFLFMDAETKKVCTVYKREDGNYGLLMAENV